MQEWLDNNDILMYSKHNEGKLVIAERFRRTLKDKIYKKLTDSNTYHHSINKKPINADYSALNKKIETNIKASKFKVNDRVRITKYKNIFSKDYPNHCLR